MKIVIAEFVLGGGLLTKTPPSSLAREASMMLQALLAELKPLNLDIAVMLDWRFQHIVSDDVEKVIVQADDHFYWRLEQALLDADFFWPIAPESDQALARMIETGGRHKVEILASDLSAIQLCSDKLATVRVLSPFLETPQTHRLSEFTPFFPAEWVIKPNDGAGCEQTYYVKSAGDYQSLALRLSPSSFIIQNWLEGRAISLSALFRQGKGWLLTVNEQIMNNENGCLRLSACRVNCPVSDPARYQNVIDNIANVIPGLWGYVGIDLIESENTRLTVLEINPRLTSSYAGIYPAVGINVAEQVLKLSRQDPRLTPSTHKTKILSLS